VRRVKFNDSHYVVIVIFVLFDYELFGTGRRDEVEVEPLTVEAAERGRSEE
jgi:hypothetical protein